MSHHDHDGHHGHHIIPLKTLSIIISALAFLTVFTVFSFNYIDIGAFNVPLALAIACTKAFLVITFFMALKYDNKVNSLVLAIGSIFVVVFLVFTLFDTAYRGDMSNVDNLTVQEREALNEAIQAQEPDPDALKVAPSDFE